MSQIVPNFSLSLGQVLWCLAGGQEAKSPLPEQVRYLRQLGVPLDPAEKGVGRGGRHRYDFYQLIELGVACEGLRLRIEPRYLTMLADERSRFRNLFRQAYKELAVDPTQFEEPAGQNITLYGGEYFLRFHDRYAATPGLIRPVLPAESDAVHKFGDWVEQYENEPHREVIALKSMMVELLRRARVAPATKPGPKH